MTVNQILALNKSVPKLEPGVMFSFDAQSLKMQKEVERLLRQLHSVATMAIQNGIKLEWGQANAAADSLVKSVIGKELFSNPTFNAWTARNEAAMNKFLNRSEKGLNLSDRVWKSVRQLRDEMEVAITVAIGDGKSAQKMSQDVRKYLNDPDLMFRRFRYKKGEEIEYDENGNEIGKKIIWGKKWKKRIKKPDGSYGWIDYDKDCYKDDFTGKGYYKSSAQNAMRVARTETNIAYRRADNERWNQMDFVLGQRINLSGNHPAKDICDKLAGDYPKEFLFDGWHPQCFCYVTPITIPPEETAHLTDMMLNGEDWRAELDKLKKGRVITKYPDNFKTWVVENKDKILNAHDNGTDPYFIRNNFKTINAILNPDSNIEPEPQQKALTPEQQIKDLTPSIENAKQLAKEWGLEDMVKNIETRVNDKDIASITTYIEEVKRLDKFYSTGINNFLTDAEKLISEMEAEKNYSFINEIKNLKHYIETLKNDKSKWVEANGHQYYESELSNIDNKWEQYKQSPEYNLSTVYKGMINVVRKRIAEALEWGLTTGNAQNVIDILIKEPNRDNYMALVAENDKLHAKLQTANNKLNKFISEAEILIKEADKLGLNSETTTMALSRYLFSLKSTDKIYTWVQFKKEIQKAYKELEDIVSKGRNLIQLSNVCDNVEKMGVTYNQVKDFTKQPTEVEIINRLAGGDKTDGSCSSLAFAYAGNKCGYDVLDFRDGDSRKFFSRNGNINDITKELGGTIVEEYDDFKAGKKLLDTLTVGKEYYFACGKHAAIVRKTATGIEYLELQSPTWNGWKPLTENTLKNRFGAQKSHTFYGTKFKGSNQLIELSLFKNKPYFKKLLGYINTNEAEQVKGDAGSTK